MRLALVSPAACLTTYGCVRCGSVCYAPEHNRQLGCGSRYAYADLDGKPFADYYCESCAMELQAHREE